MARWRVSGAHRNTGEDWSFTLEAADRQAAIDVANVRGMLVASCEMDGESAPAESPLLARPIWTISWGVACGMVWAILLTLPLAMMFSHIPEPQGRYESLTGYHDRVNAEGAGMFLLGLVVSVVVGVILGGVIRRK